MAVETGVADDHIDLFSRLRTFLTTGIGTGENWTELEYNAVAPRTMLFQAPGLAGLDEIHVGFGEAENVGADAYALRGWMFRAYNDALGPEGQPGHSGSFFHPVWNSSIPYWFIANGRRLIIVTKISTVYTASYFGMFLPYGAPGEYPQPYYIGMPRGSNIRWSDTSENFRNFYDPNAEGSRILLPTVSWFSVSNYFSGSGNIEANSDKTRFIWPFQHFVGTLELPTQGSSSSATKDRFRAMRGSLDGTLRLYPAILLASRPEHDVFGELDGVYAVPAFGAASEDLVTIGGVDHLLVQNVFRTSRHYYAAIRLT